LLDASTHAAASPRGHYGGRYDLDDLLLMAQGYREIAAQSERPESRRAIRIMQVMPATGKDMRVGDITQTDPAIHAGTKFLRATINEYYPKESMDPLNKGLFAFAANNAGPGRVGQLRKLAGPARPFESQRSVQQGRVARGGEDWPGNCDLRL
jgi:membrane-bound lytic murein transglycosylase MltF